MRSHGKKLAIIGAFLFLLGVAGTVYADYQTDVVTCALTLTDPDVDGTCCPLGASTNGRRALACLIASCGPGNIPQDPPGSIVDVVKLIQQTLGLGKNFTSPCGS